MECHKTGGMRHPNISAMDFLQHGYRHVRFWVPRQVEVFSSCLPVIVHIPQVFSEPFFKASVGLANILLLAVSHTAGDGVAQVPGVAVHLSVQLDSEFCCCGFEHFPWLNIWTRWTFGLATFLHARDHSGGSGSRCWRDFWSYKFRAQVGGHLVGYQGWQGECLFQVWVLAGHCPPVSSDNVSNWGEFHLTNTGLLSFSALIFFFCGFSSTYIFSSVNGIVD